MIPILFSAAITWPAIQQQIIQFSNLTWSRFLEIIVSPFINTEMLWILSPLIATMLMMEFYFGRYYKEELGWNTAFGNSLVLVFVSIDLIRYIYNNMLWYDPIKISLVGSIIILGILLTFLQYWHLLPKEVAFTISSRLPINFLAVMTIILIYSNIQIDYITISAILFLLTVVYIFLIILDLIIPHSEETIEEE